MASPATTPVTPTPSRRVGRYEILGRLGGGGMATVYAGRLRGPAGFERMVAIKVCHEHLNDDPSFVDMFLDEARIAAAIRHPNVVSTIEVHTEPRLYMVMELVDGSALHRVIAEGESYLPIPVALRVMVDALKGLQAAHALLDNDGRPLKVIHRDVSPANILVGTDGVTRITDFGVARAEQRAATTKDGSVKGKFGYMAPEQLRFDTLDQRVDVFAAGVCLFEVLTSTRLFRGDSEADTVARVLSGPIPRPSSVRSDIPKELDAIVLKALSRDQDRRYATAEALIRAIEACPIDLATAAEVAEHLTTLPPSLPKPIRESLVATMRDPERSGVTSRRRASSSTSIVALVAAAMFGAVIAAVAAVQLTGGANRVALKRPVLGKPPASAPLAEPVPEPQFAAPPAPEVITEPPEVAAPETTEAAAPEPAAARRRARRRRAPLPIPEPTPLAPPPDPTPPPPDPDRPYTPTVI